MLHRLLLTILFSYLGLFFAKDVAFGSNVEIGLILVNRFESQPSTESQGQVLGTQKYVSEGYNFVDGNEEVGFPQVVYKPKIKTTTAFDQMETEEYEQIAFAVEYTNDNELPYGEEAVLEAGEYGQITYKYLITYWLDDIIDKVLLSTETKEPKSEIIAVGKKIIWKEFDTPDLGKIKYWRKINVLSTKYDSTCPGCNNTTALGAPVQEGVCAVDPTVIKMYTHFYVPGYGKCQALDVGGLIKGDRIDLAFRDASTALWWTQNIDIYLMDNIPEDAVE